MSSIASSAIVFACVFGGAMLGMFLRRVLPEHHLSSDSKDVVRIGMGLVVTLSALVLGLLISSAKSAYDAQSNELTEMSAKVVLLDRVLAHYGPEAKEAREVLRRAVVGLLDRMASTGGAASPQSVAPSAGAEVLYDYVHELSPKDDLQRSSKAEAVSIVLGLGQTRWLQYAQETNSVSKPLLVILVYWLTVIFISFGLFAPRHGTAIISLVLSALAVSGAIFLILELYSPYAGIMRVSTAPLRAAIMQLGK